MDTYRKIFYALVIFMVICICFYISQLEYNLKNLQNIWNWTPTTKQYVSYRRNTSRLFPGNQPENDRIEAQMKYVLPGEERWENYKRNTHQNQSDSDRNVKLKPIRPKFKTLLIYSLRYLQPLKENQTSFLEYKCPVNECLVTNNKAMQNSVDAIFFYETVGLSQKPNHTNQIWIYMTQECPFFNPSVKHLGNKINWTINYRQDSTIVYPYGKFRYFNKSVRQKVQVQNYATGKTKKVAWFVSNCRPSNNRMGYAKELGKYIQVDIYGRCGTKVCKREDKYSCFEILKKEYKFYLAFENSNCRDYITEKFFINGLIYNAIPIVMGAHPDEYREVAPENSYIHYEDFKSPKELADYLHELDKNDTLYNEYFKWKGTGEFIDTKFWCRVCAMLHAADYYKPTWYENVWEWWAGKGKCIGKERWT
ncbi:glycoprotein 3-alpha-L-fucosyltransferase A-like [Octopus sinensis]|uniref:Fucosyltransferase n=1 Tax=Octopus sinensis TaxID=2607531 RepID=A0A6P7U6V4_9MOLL|nr:glycoprotein 3-alpha-L-fucosyltransferase A-like [Octopus sinensis]